MIKPLLVLCRGGGTGALLKLNTPVYLDDGLSYLLLARTRPFFPAGQGGECLFTNLYITLTGYDVAMGYGLLVYIDGKPISPAPNALTINYQKYVWAGGAPNPKDNQTIHELSLLQPYPAYPAVEQMRVAPRGSSIAVEFATEAGGTPNRLVIDGIEVEYEIVRETRASQFLGASS